MKTLKLEKLETSNDEISKWRNVFTEDNKFRNI